MDAVVGYVVCNSLALPGTCWQAALPVDEFKHNVANPVQSLCKGRADAGPLLFVLRARKQSASEIVMYKAQWRWRQPLARTDAADNCGPCGRHRWRQ